LQLRVRRLAAAQIHRLDAIGLRPLFVFSAGDLDIKRGHRDARWNAYPALADSFPDRVTLAPNTNKPTDPKHPTGSDSTTIS
jgi:hypothetical protein